MDDQYFLGFIAALLFLGFLISWGNDRQRRAIDGIRKAAIQWANRDIHIKRGQVSREIQINDVSLWLDRVVMQVQGLSPDIVNTEFWDQEDIEALIGYANDGNRYILSMVDRNAIHKSELKNSRQSKVNNLRGSLLGNASGRIVVEELTIMNAGVFFDLEVEKLWEVHFHKKIQVEKMYLFIVKSQHD